MAENTSDGIKEAKNPSDDVKEKASSDIVVDSGKARFSDLWRKEDYWAIWVGFFCMAVAIFLVFSNMNSTKMQEVAQNNAKLQTTLKGIEAQNVPFRTVEWYDTTAAIKKLSASGTIASVKELISWLATPARWKSNPLDSLFMTQAEADRRNVGFEEKKAKADAATKDAKDAAIAAQTLAAEAGYANADLNNAARAAIDNWQNVKAKGAKVTQAKPYNRIGGLIVLGIGLGLLCTIGAAFMGFNPVRFFIAFYCVYLICVLANILGNQLDMRKYGVNAEIWSIFLGMLIANTVGTPSLLKDGAQVEYYIKAGLVLLGAEVLFHKILAIGTPGIFVAWVVTPIVLVSTYIFGQKILKMPSRTLNIVISADMSVCGTSAAIATAAASRAKKEELTLSIGLSLTFTAIMMIVMPAFIKAVGIPEVLGGAWIGGTVDATGAVAAAGAFLGEKALAVAATVKMIQNVLIGVTAFCVALYWTTKVDVHGTDKVGWSAIWDRFPKFVLGFLAVSIFMSILSAAQEPGMAGVLVDNGTNKISVPLRGWFFALAFVSIGLTTDFRALAKYFKGGKPIILYICGQSFNLCLTLLMAWLMFYVVFRNITDQI